MANKDDSEQKDLPPSRKKLEDVRKKGQVSKSQDMVTAMVMVGCTLVIAILAEDITDHLRQLFDLVPRLYTQPFEELWPRVLAAGIDVLLHALLPLVAVTLTGVVLTNIVIIGGVLFAGEPLKPKGEKINPMEGFKRIFSVRGIVEFFKSLTKMIWLLVSLVVTFAVHLQDLMESALCGFGCIPGAFYALIKPLVITALFVFLLVGAIDVFMQRWLFRRDQRMSKTDQKRENKDMHGDPQVNQARKSQRSEASQLGSRTGVRHASIMVGAPGDWVVGICYIAGETPVPLMTCHSEPDKADTLLREAAELQIPLVRDAEIARRVAKGSANGGAVPDDMFQPVANALAAAGRL